MSVAQTTPGAAPFGRRKVLGEPLVLVVDDEAPILGIVRLTLETAGFRVLTATNGADAIALDREHDPDAVLLDLILPDISGMDVLQQIRAHRQVPVIVITADVTKGEQSLPDPDVEYLVKPFEPDELIAALRQQIASPSGGRASRMLRSGALEIDPARGVAAREGILVPLVAAERSLLKVLSANPGQPHSLEDLLVGTWGEEYRGDKDYLRLWMERLRQKVEQDPEDPRLILEDERGYRLEIGEATTS
jgi:DNA-binding response OmpR family regulator